MFYNGATHDARWRIGWIAFDRDYERVTGPRAGAAASAETRAEPAAPLGGRRGGCLALFSVGSPAAARSGATIAQASSRALLLEHAQAGLAAWGSGEDLALSTVSKWEMSSCPFQ